MDIARRLEKSSSKFTKIKRNNRFYLDHIFIDTKDFNFIDTNPNPPPHPTHIIYDMGRVVVTFDIASWVLVLERKENGVDIFS